MGRAAQRSWHEGHNTAGATATGEKWGLAEGEVGGARGLETYILIGNTSAARGDRAGDADLRGRDARRRATSPLDPNSRTNVAVSSAFPEAVGRRFGAVVEAVGPTPVQIVVERAMYNDAGGVTWAAGTSALGTKLR